MGWRTVATGVVVHALLVSLALCAIAPGLADAAPAPVVFDQVPASATNQTSATFKFHDPQGTASFTCELDSVSVSPCTANTALTYSNLAEGQHAYSVNVLGGAATTPATYTWTVDLTP
ncbi:MAG TPA: hypothetical protein VNV17_07700, partial [Solirubrobacteraceae bacterium]|nr:hypothetical protein [Solirubrobacteraceae bacterium]